MRTKSFGGLWAMAALSLCLGACKDAKTAQENEQLKTQVAELQKENGQLGNELESVTASRDELAKENASLKLQPTPGKSRSKRAVVRKTRRRHHRRQSVS